MCSSRAAELAAHLSVQISYLQLFLTLPSNEFSVCSSSDERLSAQMSIRMDAVAAVRRFCMRLETLRTVRLVGACTAASSLIVAEVHS